MTKTVKIHEAKTHLSRLLTAVEAGGEFIIARGSKPIAKVIPIAPPAQRRPGLLAHLGRVPKNAFAPMSDEELIEVFGSNSF